ncbi:MAG: alpha-L-fucosidase [Spirochaetia bacterium]|nr:alpha-L-fucosidase [Spirochaetia bacterium]
MKRTTLILMIIAVAGCNVDVWKDREGAVDLAKIRSAAMVKPHERQLAWQQLELTAFFHFGINTFTGNEWGDGKENPKMFNPTQLDCRQWVKAIKAGGFKLAILTAKHHDGFCLWPSDYTDHDVASSSYKNGKGDVVQEFVDACRAENIKIGIYLSPWDRHEKTYGTEAYNEYFNNQIIEIFDKYGPDIDEFWFDGAVDSEIKQMYDWNRFYNTIREKNPNCVIAVCGPDVRWVGNESGLARESEWSVVPASAQDQNEISSSFEEGGFHYTEPNKEIEMYQYDSSSEFLGDRVSVSEAEKTVWYPAECDTSIRPGWFYHESQDIQVKSLSTLMDIYYKSVGRNSVLLLNIPPDKRGLLHEKDVERLKEFGDTVREVFSRNIAVNAVRKDSTPEGADYRMTVELDLGSSQYFNRLSIGENIANGQRVEKFALEVWNGYKWKEVERSTTIGYKRLLKFPRQKAQKVRIRIEQARFTPEISSIGLYNSLWY